MEGFMNVKSLLRKLVCGMAVLGVLAIPVMVKADGLDLKVNIGDNDQAHFDFNGGPKHHHPMIWRAAQQLRQAKATLWKAADDFNGHKADAIQAINAALDQLKVCESK
jgi:hypothetical protein